jgi:glycosyltransferase involved in cell wall biosynthesis
VDPRNPVALAEAIIRVSEDPALAARVSRNASEELRRNYTQDRMVASYLDLYRSLMRGKHRQEALPPEVPVRR